MTAERPLLCSALAALLLFSAACEKKEKLTGPGFVLVISPTATRMTANAQKTFTARAVSPTGAALESSPEWSVSSSALGIVSPETGNEVTFYAGETLGVTGTLQAAYGGLTAAAQITVGSETGDPSKSYGFYTESLVNGIRLDILNLPNTNGGFLGAFQGEGDGFGGTGTILLETATGAGEVTEGSKALKATANLPGALSYAGYFFQFGYDGTPSGGTAVATNMSAFSGGTVKFDIRVPQNQDAYLKLEWQGGSKELQLSNFVTFDGGYHSISIPLSSFTGLDLSQFTKVTFSVKSPALGTFSFYLDNLRFEKS